MPITEAPPKVPLEKPRLRPDMPQDPAELHLLIEELEDDRERSRWRESAWISVVLHLLIIIAIILQPKLFPDLFSSRDQVVLVTPEMKDNDINYLALPKDQQQAVRPPKANILSDKDRVAQARQPTLDRHTLEELQNMRRPGPPAPKGMQAPPPQPSASAAAPQQGQQQQAQPPAKPPENTNSMAKLEQPEQEKPINRNVFSTAGSAGSAIQEAARAAAAGHGGQGGEYGLQLSPNSSAKSDIDVLTDTLGVDFGPYLSRVIEEIRQSWYGLMPESVIYPPHIKGKVTLQFIIQKDGSVAGLRYIEPSGDIALDRPAYGSITANNPFPPLPKDFVERGGSILGLRIRYYYNPDKGDLLR
jgi:TonB family protein